MSLLESITKGKENKPPRLLIYGTGGVGKSTHAAAPPTPYSSRPRTGWMKSTQPNSRWRTA